ncbi:MAG: YebC/PmpR family DNA-binding transcriptional regulator [Acidobacteriota bacterium]|nr:YebC/PmpR family DNA-binding transcriptional regulator [Blastocatellia bacterium]MDW8412950.1 YebC/PmpR family DNA-binding transcriptional regulator [Acidobacteriota bacterium]
MSGHSKWHTIKHKKGALDAKRGKIFTKLIKEITVAARTGGGDVAGNPRLRKAIADAKAQNMPNDTIERAIKRGTGELSGDVIEEITYEGYGPGGVAIMIDAATDNKNRTVGELRHIFSKNGGNLGEAGCVSWMFSKKGVIVIDKTARSEEELFELALGAGADDLKDDGDGWTIYTSVENFETVLDAVKTSGVTPISADIVRVPQNTVRIEGREAQMLLKLLDTLEDHDDVQKVASNFDMDVEELQKAV